MNMMITLFDINLHYVIIRLVAPRLHKKLGINLLGSDLLSCPFYIVDFSLTFNDRFVCIIRVFKLLKCN